jgi:hypothetical protein
VLDPFDPSIHIFVREVEYGIALVMQVSGHPVLFSRQSLLSLLDGK